MFTPKDVAEVDQANKWIESTLPGHWWRIFTACREEGFDDEQSLRILLKYLGRVVPQEDPT